MEQARSGRRPDVHTRAMANGGNTFKHLNICCCIGYSVLISRHCFCFCSSRDHFSRFICISGNEERELLLYRPRLFLYRSVSLWGTSHLTYLSLIVFALPIQHTAC